MNKINNFHFPFEELNAQLDRLGKLYESPFADVIAQQQALMRAVEPLSGFEKNISSYDKIASSAGVRCFENPLQDLINSCPKIYGADFPNLLQSSTFATITDSLSPLIKSFGIQNAADIGLQLTSGLEPFLSALDAIRVTPEYVEVPEKLIPDDFEYDEETDAPAKNGNIVKLPREVARQLFWAILVQFVSAYLATFMPSQPETWQKQYHQEEMENDAKLIQQNETIIQQNEELIELQKQEYEAYVKGIEILTAIYNQLPSEEDPPAFDFPPQISDSSSSSCTECHQPDADLSDRQVDLSSHPAEPQPSTAPASPAEAEQPSETD